MKRCLILWSIICLFGMMLSGATINFTGPDGTAVFLENRELGRVPLTISVKPQVPYVFKYLAPGYEPKWQVISLKRDGKYDNEITLQPISATVMITSTPSGAVLYTNGVKNKTTPLVLEKVPVGKYTGELRLPGFAPMPIEWEVKDERPIRRDFALQENNGKVRIASEPSGAAIWVNGKEEGFTPRTLTLPEGTYQVRLEKNGFLAQENMITVFRGKKESHKITLQARPGDVMVSSTPSGAAVFLEDRRIGETPLELKNMQPGEYTLLFRKPGFDDIKEKITVISGKKESVDIKLMTYLGSLELYVKPAGVSVTLDGRSIGEIEPDEAATGAKPMLLENLKTGTHKLKLSHPHATPQEVSYEVEIFRGKKTLKRYSLWIPNCEITYIHRKGKKEIGILLADLGDEILFSPEAGVQYTVFKKNISIRMLKNH
jgi:hypothetical protein